MKLKDIRGSKLSQGMQEFTILTVVMQIQDNNPNPIT